MKFLLSGAILASALTLGACSDVTLEEEEVPTEDTVVFAEPDVVTDSAALYKEPAVAASSKLYRYNAQAQEDRIVLQHPVSREISVCDSHTFTENGIISEEVEKCARELEEFGFIRVTNKPRFVNEDMEKSDSVYPYRLYHRNDLTPRW